MPDMTSTLAHTETVTKVGTEILEVMQAISSGDYPAPKLTTGLAGTRPFTSHVWIEILGGLDGYSYTSNTKAGIEFDVHWLLTMSLVSSVTVSIAHVMCPMLWLIGTRYLYDATYCWDGV
ncbi:hypothetical protein N7517_010614 [Penicillium concentricum]|uniref:Uncharacterized protein n=1 Tax=Penicillium concentricum TaxID=293559 RepID=A0A9W9UUL6_9EURO|nr:uncharacterized protein N7517_010614 [Penicillium concentricum]KAJ5356005.1 hypothetical protein N7517_010614 [Penicillium concentricum]